MDHLFYSKIYFTQNGFLLFVHLLLILFCSVWPNGIQTGASHQTKCINGQTHSDSSLQGQEEDASRYYTDLRVWQPYWNKHIQ